MLSEEEKRIIIHKGTERAFSGEYNDFFEEGIYICRQYHKPLYRSSHKFPTHCGWASFDDEIKNAILREKDKDGIRIEIMCANCKGHLGHIFYGEGLSAKNTRHCVNSLSIRFIPNNPPKAENEPNKE